MRSARLTKKSRSRGPLSQLLVTRNPLIAKKISTPKKPNEAPPICGSVAAASTKECEKSTRRGGAEAQQVERVAAAAGECAERAGVPVRRRRRSCRGHRVGDGARAAERELEDARRSAAATRSPR